MSTPPPSMIQSDDDFCYDLSEAAKADRQYVVEKVLAKRLNDKGKREYLLNWVGFTNKDNTWEIEDDIYPNLIADFEREQRKLDGTNSISNKHLSVQSSLSSSMLKKKSLSNVISLPTKELFGVQQGWRVRAVIGAKKQKNSSILYAVDYVRGSPLLREYIPSEIAHIHIPQEIISFFQNITVWNSSNKAD